MPLFKGGSSSSGDRLSLKLRHYAVVGAVLIRTAPAISIQRSVGPPAHGRITRGRDQQSVHARTCPWLRSLGVLGALAREKVLKKDDIAPRRKARQGQPRCEPTARLVVASAQWIEWELFACSRRSAPREHVAKSKLKADSQIKTLSWVVSQF